MKTKIHLQLCKYYNYGEKYHSENSYILNQYYWDTNIYEIYAYDIGYRKSFLILNVSTDKLENYFEKYNGYKIGKKLDVNDLDYLEYEWEEINEN